MGRKEETSVAKQHMVKEWDKSCSDERSGTDMEKLTEIYYFFSD